MGIIHLLHTNDIHSHFENWPRISRYLLEKQAEYDESLTFDIGDAIDRLHPLTEATLGTSNVMLMNRVHYDGVTIGNNEGLVFSHRAMNHLYDDANFDVLLANLKELPNSTQPQWAKNYKIIVANDGTKIGVIGLTAPYQLTYPALGWQPIAVDKTLEKYLPILRSQVDVILVLSHLGLPTDERIAETYDVDVIMGAHTHHLLPQGKMINKTLLAAAGRYGENIGDIKLTIKDHKIVDKSATTTPIYMLSEQDDDYKQIRSWVTEGKALLERQYIGTLPREITVDEQVYDSLRALKQYYGVPAAMISTGMFSESLPKGKLSRYELLESMPHSINPMLLTLSGHKIISLLNSIEDQITYLSDYPMKGSGFRGKIFGYMRFDGIDRQKDGQILYNGKIIEENKLYKIATLDHYKWIPFFPDIAQAPVKIELNLILRELMANYYTNKYKDN
ncbi:bifunctional metallophosphatase/5'-nucleotidase [Leuconostoc litchii]|uniref:Bifunctional metallophosphatase/5'-nucleotidase n=1 Tax=Leuconostoc litchii TaxID=1981069 RepID=A0A6P2CR72_9LACO|nr:bifunctional UDP-sugar hydrolase/5'-nucleotidase [Leuconostoc litchii]TYC46759.1 bifunctional metallophosphatase/5'-nucleotidase [Leuconostoc litchii]